MGFEIILFMIFGAVLLGGGGLYACDPKGWNATGRRLTTIVRANLESKKETKALKSGVTEKDLIANWDNQYQGKDLAVTEKVKPHEIVKTRLNSGYYGDAEYKWWCRCGASDWHVSEDAAMRDFKRHLEEGKRIEAQKKKAADFRKRGLDRDW